MPTTSVTVQTKWVIEHHGRSIDMLHTLQFIADEIAEGRALDEPLDEYLITTTTAPESTEHE